MKQTFDAAFASFSDTGDGAVSGALGWDGHGWRSDELPAGFELVWDLLLQLNAHNSVGPNGIPPRALKSWSM